MSHCKFYLAPLFLYFYYYYYFIIIFILLSYITIISQYYYSYISCRYFLVARHRKLSFFILFINLNINGEGHCLGLLKKRKKVLSIKVRSNIKFKYEHKLLRI